MAVANYALSLLSSSTRPVLEGLEGRTLLAASLDGGILTVAGTDGADSITVGLNSAGTRYSVNINGDAQTFNVSAVNKLVINAGAGNDKVQFNERNGRLTVSPTIDGGDGNDRITGSTRKDKVTGGRGRDFILGAKGNDRLSGESDADTLFGDAGDDLMFGGSGNDVMGGDDEGKLVIAGQSIPTQISGNDSLNGGSGDDWLLGGIRYERGSDDQQPPNNAIVVVEDDDTDTFTGGDGADVIDARGNDDEITDLVAEDTVPSRELRAGSQTNNHIHVQLNVRIRNADGTTSRVVVPHAIGQFEGGVDAVHTHDGTGNIHFEAADNDGYTIGEFLENWGLAVDKRLLGRTLTSKSKPITVRVTPDGGTAQVLPLADLRSYEPDDGDEITITIA